MVADRSRYPFLAILLASVSAWMSPVANAVTPMKEDNEHVRKWNQFADDCYALHKQQIKGKEIVEKTKLGGYARQPEFYKQVEYYDKESNRLLSRIQWERKKPDQIHGIEVFVYNKDGKLIRDFTAAYLPNYRNAPVQTLINLHHYDKDVHGFRQFDAGGDRIYEQCAGTFEGKPVQLRIFEEDLFSDATEALMQKPLYKSCFGDLPMRPGMFLTPQ